MNNDPATTEPTAIAATTPKISNGEPDHRLTEADVLQLIVKSQKFCMQTDGMDGTELFKVFAQLVAERMFKRGTAAAASELLACATERAAARASLIRRHVNPNQVHELTKEIKLLHGMVQLIGSLEQRKTI